MRRWCLSVMVVAGASVVWPVAVSAAAVAALPFPEPAGTTHTEPAAVSCPTDSECLSAGSWLNGSYVRSGLIERWSGSGWRIMPQAAPRGRAGHPVFLFDISCPAASKCVVIGTRRDYSRNRPAAPSTPVSEQWNGSRWQRVSIAAVNGVAPELDAVSCTTVSICLAVGSVQSDESTRAVAESYNGRSWHVSYIAATRVGRSAFSDVSCAASLCVAVGTQHQQRRSSAQSILAWDRGRWKSVPLADPHGDAFGDVSCADSTDCLITGVATTPTTKGVLLHFNGRSLTAIPVADGNTLGLLSCGSPSFCLVLGSAGATPPPAARTPIADAWNGATLSPAFSGHTGAVACRPSFCMLATSSRGHAAAYRYQPHGARAMAVSS
jgi:hypothetical protein